MREPQRVASGDSLIWERAVTDFSANDCTLHYVLRSERNIYKFDATNNAGAFLVTVNSATTANWAVGKYLIGAYVTNGSGEQLQVQTAFPSFVVGPNLAINPQGVSTTSWAAKCLAEIENVIFALTSRTTQSASINGSAYTLQNIGDLFKMRERFKSAVRVEEMQERLNAGLGAGNKVAVTFPGIRQYGWRAQNNWEINPPWQ